MIYSYEQINATHGLLMFLRKLRVMGLMKTKVQPITELGQHSRRYTMKMDGYYPGVFVTKSERVLEALASLTRETERLNLYDEF